MVRMLFSKFRKLTFRELRPVHILLIEASAAIDETNELSKIFSSEARCDPSSVHVFSASCGKTNFVRFF